MNAVGIDVSKGKSTVIVLGSLKEIVRKPFNVCHTATELGDLVNYLKSLGGESKIIMECTGRYYEPIAQFLHCSGLFVSAINPLLIKGYGGGTLRNVKTDKADANKIARYGLDHWLELREYTPMDEIRYQLKVLNQQYDLFIRQQTALKNNLISLLDQTFPGINGWFSSAPREDGSQKWIDFVAIFWHVDCVRKVSLSAFTERYRKFCEQHNYNFNADMASKTHSRSKELVALVQKTPITKLMLKEAVSQLQSIMRTAATICSEMNRLASQLPEYPAVMGMFGAGYKTGPQLIAEIGDVRRFTTKHSLAAFAGVDPSPKQSGTQDRKSNHVSKRGSPLLRKTLFTIMTILLRNMPTENAVYRFLDKKRSEGKLFYVYMTAGANKFLRIYYGVVRDHLNTLGAHVPCVTSADP